MGTHQLAPAGEVAWRSARDRSARQFLTTGEAAGRELRWHGRDEVQRSHPPFGRDVACRHAHAGQPRHVRFGDVQRRGGGCGGVECIAAGAEYRGARLRRLWMRRGDVEPTRQRFWFALDLPAQSPGARISLTYDSQLIADDPVVEPIVYEAISYLNARALDPSVPAAVARTRRCRARPIRAAASSPSACAR